MSKRVIFGLEDLLTTCETLDEFRNSSELIKGFDSDPTPFMVSKRTMNEVRFFDQSFDENSMAPDLYDDVLQIGRDYGRRASEYAVADQYVLELFMLDTSRPAFAVDAVASYLGTPSEVTNG
jgi:hypothetical protein